MGRMSAKLCGTAVAAASALVTTLGSSELPDVNSPPFLVYATPPSMPVPPLCASHDCSCLLKVVSTPDSTAATVRRYANRGSSSSTPVIPPEASSSVKDTLPPHSRHMFLFSERTSSGLPSSSIMRASGIDACSIRPEIIRLSTLSTPLFSNCSPLLHFSSSSSPFRFSLMHDSILSPVASASFSPRASITSWSSSFMVSSFRDSSAALDYLPKWDSIVHDSKIEQQSSECRSADGDTNILKPKTKKTVVLLGWLGAQQKHLKSYAEWYNERGINAVTFVIPMRDVISLNTRDKSEQLIQHLAKHLATWLSEENNDGEQNCVLFHTFSNTGWLTYGVILEKLLEKDPTLLNKIKGCVVDSAPAAKPDPQVWASGFSAAFLKKRSVAAQKVGHLEAANGTASTVDEEHTSTQPKAAKFLEVAVKVMLEKFFSNFLQLPYVKQRLAEVVSVLSKHQPHCPQLYIYSSADAVIPAQFVESFIEEQRKAGHIVKAYNFLWSPHVDHFRSFPEVYSTQLSNFIQECFR
ncbi:hypothetical protein O6H91_22G020500 [Diphasiastrum complanatum]|uniref:Uncharacterized protein n=2 Tax=Diphasiastrum complanatum TaxID=34168 RepID=A0ACC2ADK8_DIPCM|nr:hypothetical protein O6H91_22G020500 [Diphasiastrum complanatum]KAJ7515619.1 hypothetical protein O6H91_22G020500 [Diphasiastrum complanatum]